MSRKFDDILILCKIIGLLLAAACSGCSIASAKMHDEPPPDLAVAEIILPVPQTEPLPPAAAPVERSQPDGVEASDTAPGAAQLPEVLIYGPPSCAPCARAIKELNDSGKYAAHHADITPAIQKIANEWNQGGYPIATFRDKKSDERFVAPYRGLRDFDQRYNRTMKDRAATGLQEASPPNVAAHSWPAGTNTETSPAYLRYHLVHDHGYSQAQVNRMTHQECWQAHQNAHGNYSAPMMNPDARADVWDGFFGLRRERLARKGKL